MATSNILYNQVRQRCIAVHASRNVSVRRQPLVANQEINYFNFIKFGLKWSIYN